MTPKERYAHYMKHRLDGQSFIQHVTSSPSFKKGALTAEAKKNNMTAMEFAHHVLANPESHTLKTRRRAQFAVNAQSRK